MLRSPRAPLFGAAVSSQLFTRQDPFVRVTLYTPYHRSTLETLPVWGGGTAPKWSESHRNALHFDFVGEENGVMTLKVRDGSTVCTTLSLHGHVCVGTTVSESFGTYLGASGDPTEWC